MSVDSERSLGVQGSVDRLLDVVEQKVGVSPQTLSKCIADVLASRTGDVDGWLDLDELWLSTEAGIKVNVWRTDEVNSIWLNPRAWMQTVDVDETSQTYYIKKNIEGVGENSIFYELWLRDPEDENEDIVISPPELAAARLLSILAKAHDFTPIETLEYEPLTDPEEVTVALKECSNLNPDKITDEDLFQSIVDIIACRGGERWRDADEIVLKPNNGIELRLGLYQPFDPEPYWTAWITVYPEDKENQHYIINELPEGYRLSSDRPMYKIGDEGIDDFVPIPEAFVVEDRVRLIGLLLDGHLNTPLISEEPTPT